MEIDPAMLETAADWCINLSAGWFGAAFIIPVTEDRPHSINQWLLIENLVLSLAFFMVSYILKAI